MLKGKFALAVGTPNRLHKLFQLGALALNKTKLIIIDLKKDAKNFHLLSSSDLREDLKLFMESAVAPQLGRIKLIFAES